MSEGNIQTIGFNNMETFSQATKRVIRETVNKNVIISLICITTLIIVFWHNL